MFRSINPYTNTIIKDYPLTTRKELEFILNQTQQAHVKWKQVPLASRLQQIKELGSLLEKNLKETSELITQEVGKPIQQSKAEVKKCIQLCYFYEERGEIFLKNKQGNTSFKSYVTYEPLGVILGIMPWNYPFWQVFRFVVPTLLSGNSVVLKHASNVGGCANFIESLLAKALSVDRVFNNLFLSNESTTAVITNPIIKGVSLTGSTKAGKSVASVAGTFLKPVLLELGGSNALIVCKDAAIDKAIDACILGRFQNNGQSCIAVKRLLLDASIEKEFVEKLTQKVKNLKKGDPFKEDTYISVLAKPEFVTSLNNNLKESLEEGANLICGGNYKDSFFEPTLVSNVTSNMALFKKETFGPVLPILSFKTLEEAINLANTTQYGLGVSVFTENKELAKKIIPKFNDGAVFINSIVKSIPSLPFGGTKTSGLGRELAEEGIKAFVNVKTVVIN